MSEVRLIRGVRRLIYSGYGYNGYSYGGGEG